MFGLGWLRTRKDLSRRVEDLKGLAAHLEGEVALRASSGVLSRVLESLDDFSNDLCKVLDSAEVIRCAHVDPRWREEATAAKEELTTVVHSLNASSGLAHALRTTTTNGPNGSPSEEEERVRRNLISEITSDNENVVAIQGRLDKLNDTFLRNLNSQSLLPKITLQPETNISNGNALLSSNTTKPQVVPLTPWVTNYLLRTAHSEDLRREVYLQSLRSPRENLRVVDEILELRQALAEEAGSVSGFSEHTLKVNSLAKAPGTVLSFLDQLSGSVTDVAQEAHRSLLKLKRNSNTNVSSKERLFPWEVSYLENQARALSTRTIDNAALSNYFSLRSCLSGIELVLRETFGIECTVEEVDPSQSWCGGAGGLSKLTLRDGQTGSSLGVVYLDLFQREGKAKQNAHYVIQCARRKSDQDIQEAVVVLLCTFSGGNNKQGSEGHGHGYESRANTLLFPSEVKTLFHEFGHALHSVLSSSKYHYLSGTRGEVDFVEVPSTLFEKFGLNPKVVGRYAKNVQTGEALPAGVMQPWLEGERLFKALHLQNQIALASSDQKIHHNFSFDKVGGMGVSEIFVGETEKHSLVPHSKGTSPQLRFQHLALYPAYYYSYIYAQCISGKLWHDLFHDDPFNWEAGHMIRQLLSDSAAKDPTKLLARMGNGQAYASSKGSGSVPALPTDLRL